MNQDLIKSAIEKGKSVGRFHLTKFASQEDFEKGIAYEDGDIGDNILLNEGINALFTVACSSSGTKFDNTNANLGVGDSTTAAAASQTGLQATTNKVYVGMDSGYPTYGTSQQATWRATFGSGVANFAWNEFTVANGTSDSASNLDRLVSAQGTKTSGQVWQLSLTITLS